MTPYYGPHAGITIYHGDAREILPTLQRESIDLVLTDPPYGIGLRNGDVDGHRSARWNSVVGDSDQSVGQEVLDWAESMNLPVITFASPWLPWPGEWRNLIVWDKGGGVGGGGDIKTCLKRSWELIQVRKNGIMPGRRIESVWRFQMSQQGTALHICAKPVSLMVALMSQFGGNSIVDPFCGSGPTLEAAQRLGRKAIGIDIEERYCETSAKRLSQEVMDFGSDREPVKGSPEWMARLGAEDEIKEDVLRLLDGGA